MKKILLVATLLVAGLVSASNGNSKLKHSRMPKTAKKVKRASEKDCIPAYYHGCVHATTCVTNIIEALEWADRIHENYCSK